MKRLVIVGISAILLVGLILTGLSCASQTTLDIAVTHLENGVIVENVGNVDCLVFINSPEGEQQFELAIGDNVTVTDVSQPIGVSAVSW